MSVTVYGCVNPDMTITFENLETCLEQSACLVRSGVHVMQIALTLSGADNEDCNDIFYSSCFDPITGKFQVEIPDNCCSYACEYCTGDVPYHISVYFTGISTCGCIGSWPALSWSININGAHTLLFYDGCTWLGEGPTGTFKIWDSQDCDVLFDTWTAYSSIIATLGDGFFNIFAACYNVDPEPGWETGACLFSGSDTVVVGQPCASYSGGGVPNGYTEEDCGNHCGSYWKYGYGGTASYNFS